MKKFLLFILLGYLAVANSCNLKVLNFDINDSINLTIHSSKKCKGYGVKLKLKDNSAFKFYVNFTPKIVNQAPPFGFSLSDGKEFISLGVDKNIIDSKLDAKLLENSKIYDIKNGFNIYWHISLKNLNELQKITAENIEIRHMDSNKCKILYLSYLSKTRDKPITVDKNKFINFCKSTWVINDSNSLLEELIKISTSNLKSIKEGNNSEILNFIKGTKHKKSNKKSCKIYVDLIDMNSLNPINSNNFTFWVEKINGESYERKFKKSSFKLLKGSYGIKAISKRYSGTSQIINCDGGDYYVTIPVFAHI